MSVLRAGLCLLIAFSVLAFGAVEVWSGSVVEIGAAALFVFWALLTYRDPGAKIRWKPLNWPLLGLIGIGLFQFLFRGTAYAFLTRMELLKLASYFLIFFLTAQAFRTRRDLSRLAWFVIAFCFLVSLLAIIQHFTSGGEIYWLSEYKMQGEPFGPYVNRNHFAGFVELTLPIGLALMTFRGVRRELVPLTTLLTIVPISAIVLSGSRGGIISFVFEVGILVLLARSRRALHAGRLAAVAIVAAAALALVIWVGAGTAIERLSASKPHDVSRDRRVSMFLGAAHIFLDHPIKGSGLGTLVDVYPRYETAYDGKVVDHVHNDYIELLAETGLLGGACAFGFLWLLYREARKNFAAEQGRFSCGLHAGAIVAVSGLLLHSFVDFNLHIPANALLFLLQACIATSPPLPSEGSPSHSRRAAMNSAANPEVADAK
ncbi:MAG TPA: O-antigen ligase family protein [Candidatus Acidoferrales bacterium]|nr:O-antigen ligase family protein [Candidatus Acidoferrales bacterium]